MGSSTIGARSVAAVTPTPAPSGAGRTGATGQPAICLVAPELVIKAAGCVWAASQPLREACGRRQRAGAGRVAYRHITKMSSSSVARLVTR